MAGVLAFPGSLSGPGLECVNQCDAPAGNVDELQDQLPGSITAPRPAPPASSAICVICVICGYLQDFQKSVAKRNKTMSLKKNRENIPFDKKPQKRPIFAKGFGSKKNPLRRFLEK
jgi:hypothetical protein